MADNKSLLQILMEQAGKVAKPVGSAVGQGTADITSLLGSLLGINVPQQAQTAQPATTESPVSPEQKAEIPGQPEKMPSMKETFESQLNPLQENVWKTVKKVQKDQITEAMQSGVPAENILDQTGLTQAITNSMLTKTPASSPFGFGGAELKDGQVIEKQPGFLAALLSTVMTGSPKTAANMDLKRLGLIQELAGQQPLQKGKREELGLTKESDLEKMATEYGYKAQIEAMKSGLDPNSPAVSAGIFQEDLLNLISAFEDMPIKGKKGFGTLGALASSVGVGREQRARYEALSESFVYSFASYVAQQQGRALDKDEVKRFRNIIKLKTGDTMSSVEGKIQAMIDLANTRAKKAGLAELPDAKTFISQIRQSKTSSGKKYGTGNIKSITPVGE